MKWLRECNKITGSFVTRSFAPCDVVVPRLSRKLPRASAAAILLHSLILAVLVCASPNIFAKTKTVRKVQEVAFDEANLKGTARNPDGVYLVQKRGMKFLPLHDLKKDMDGKIRESAMYVH